MSEEMRFSLSSEEDVYDFLSQLSYVYEGKDNNDEMFSTYFDFLDLVENISDNKYIKLFHDIKIGKCRHDKRHKTVENQCAEEFGVSADEFEEKLSASVEGLVELKRERWLDYVNKKYNGVYFSESVTDNECVDDSKAIELDRKIKYKYDGAKELTEEDEARKDEDLKDLVEYESRLASEIDRLSSEGKSGTSECRRMVSTRIDVRKDINVIRKSHGEVLSRKNSHGGRSFTTFEVENPYYDEIAQRYNENKEIERADQHDEMRKEIDVSRIRDASKKVLTKLQYIIFEFYYFNGLTQQEIAEIMGIKRHTVSEHLSRALNNIKKHT